jgi:hypothetical protein
MRPLRIQADAIDAPKAIYAAVFPDNSFLPKEA